ncbi:DUF1127 domain-containing protein [Lichenicola sp.]|uniref:DUF1127 domain-containing protein n=1 Tax=Lichenicola sp. TaxID=2804529 RepID=UPI003B0100DE
MAQVSAYAPRSTIDLSVLARALVDVARNSIEQHRKRARVRNELYCYSDRELSDLGFSRSDIPAVAAGQYTR